MVWELIDYKHRKIIEKLPIQCKKKYAVFKYIISCNGVEGLKMVPGFKLEALQGNLAGLFSIRLNIAYRVVFEVTHEIKIVEIIEIAKHRYLR
jgi:plasmid maintenance system killer protein